VHMLCIYPAHVGLVLYADVTHTHTHTHTHIHTLLLTYYM